MEFLSQIKNSFHDKTNLAFNVHIIAYEIVYYLFPDPELIQTLLRNHYLLGAKRSLALSIEKTTSSQKQLMCVGFPLVAKDTRFLCIQQHSCNLANALFLLWSNAFIAIVVKLQTVQSENSFLMIIKIYFPRRRICD